MVSSGVLSSLSFQTLHVLSAGDVRSGMIQYPAFIPETNGKAAEGTEIRIFFWAACKLLSDNDLRPYSKRPTNQCTTWATVHGLKSLKNTAFLRRVRKNAKNRRVFLPKPAISIHL